MKYSYLNEDCEFKKLYNNLNIANLKKYFLPKEEEIPDYHTERIADDGELVFAIFNCNEAALKCKKLYSNLVHRQMYLAHAVYNRYNNLIVRLVTSLKVKKTIGSKTRNFAYRTVYPADVNIKRNETIDKFQGAGVRNDEKPLHTKRRQYLYYNLCGDHINLNKKNKDSFYDYLRDTQQHKNKSSGGTEERRYSSKAQAKDAQAMKPKAT